MQSDFENNNKKGFGFGCSRDDMEITGPFVSTKMNKNPGPGSYEQKSTLNKTFFTFRGKNHRENKEKKQIPGPGSCN